VVIYLLVTVNIVISGLCQGTIIAVSHDQAFVNRVIAKDDARRNGGDRNGRPEERDGLSTGELWVMSKGRLMRYDGSFESYKKLVLKKMLAEEEL